MTIHETLTTIWDTVVSPIPLIPDLWQPSPPQDGLLLPINGYKQTQSYTCGAVSGFAVAEYFRPALRFDTFCRRVNPDPIWGTSPRKLAAALRKSGITVSERRRMTYRDLILALEGGSPVLVHTWIDRGEDLTHW